jgi:hypothetical protein
MHWYRIAYDVSATKDEVEWDSGHSLGLHDAVHCTGPGGQDFWYHNPYDGLTWYDHKRESADDVEAKLAEDRERPDWFCGQLLL